MRSIRKKKRGMSAENIARLADKGKDVSRFFTNAGQMMSPIQRVNVDFASPMLDELDNAGDSDEADRHSDLIAITVSGWIRSVVGAKRRWRMDFPESDRDRQACCC